MTRRGKVSLEKEKESLCPEGTVLQKTHHQTDDVQIR